MKTVKFSQLSTFVFKETQQRMHVSVDHSRPRRNFFNAPCNRVVILLLFGVYILMALAIVLYRVFAINLRVRVVKLIAKILTERTSSLLAAFQV